MAKNRRKHFLINKPLQFRYMFYFVFTLLVVSGVTGLSFYYGVWSGVFESFSDDKVQNDLIMAARLTQYEEARTPKGEPTADAVSFFKQAGKLSLRQREIFNDILNETNRKLLPKFLILLFFIGWASIFLSHKIAGPIYRLQKGLEDLGKRNLQTRIYFRKHDEAAFISTSFNGAVESLDNSLIRIKNIAKNESDPEQFAKRIKAELSKIKTSADH